MPKMDPTDKRTPQEKGMLFDLDEHNRMAADGVPEAQEYARQLSGGKWDPEGLDIAATTPEQWSQGASEFESSTTASGPVPDRMLKSYEVLGEHVSKQFDFLTTPKEKGGAGLSVEATPENPYPTFHEMRQDVSENNRLNVLATSSTGSHEVMSDEMNDKFRAVHDYFGHYAIGRSFDRHGEEAAARSHMMMFPPEARQALAAETRGQNAYLIDRGTFTNQDVPRTDLPDWMTAESEPKVPASPPPSRHGSGEGQLTLDF